VAAFAQCDSAFVPRTKGLVDEERESIAMADKVTIEVVGRVAELANLELTQAESVEMVRDLNSILDYVAQLSELDTSQVEPLAQVTELMHTGKGRLREDALAPSLERAAVLSQAPETDGAFFKVPKVIER
jgi:aspartyl-tRNA(Asn)/glutamyl-tRNA(Gln) amidotransferase subunit C